MEYGCTHRNALTPLKKGAFTFRTGRWYMDSSIVIYETVRVHGVEMKTTIYLQHKVSKDVTVEVVLAK